MARSNVKNREFNLNRLLLPYKGLDCFDFFVAFVVNSIL